MRLNREKGAAALAAVILVATLSRVALGIVSPTRVARVDITLPSYSRELIPQKYRMFREEAPVARNPFSLSEGWQGMEAVPMPPPPLPASPRLVPLLGKAAGPEDVGFLFDGGPPPQEPKKGGAQ
jgi:hypothetical protein